MSWTLLRLRDVLPTNELKGVGMGGIIQDMLAKFDAFQQDSDSGFRVAGRFLRFVERHVCRGRAFKDG